DEAARVLGPVLAVGLDVAARQRFGVGVVVVGEDAVAGGLERVPDPRCPREQVEDRPHLRQAADHPQDLRDQQALRAEVLDHFFLTLLAGAGAGAEDRSVSCTPRLAAAPAPASSRSKQRSPVSFLSSSICSFAAFWYCAGAVVFGRFSASK